MPKCGWPHPFGCTSNVQVHQQGMATSADPVQTLHIRVNVNVRETVALLIASLGTQIQLSVWVTYSAVS